VIQSFGVWPYEGKRTIVVSRSPGLEVQTDKTELFSGELTELIERLKADECRKVWLVGGGELIRSFLKQGLLDEITVSMHPILLGKGVPLFPGGFSRTMLLLKDTTVFDGGLVQLNYHVMPDEDAF
jgi:dihydrofolate reductase